MASMQVLVIGKISSAVVLAGAAYQDEAGYARMTGLPREKTRLLDDKGGTDTQVCLEVQLVLRHIWTGRVFLRLASACWSAGVSDPFPAAMQKRVKAFSVQHPEVTWMHPALQCGCLTCG